MHGRRDPARDVVLDLEDVRQRTVVALGPDVVVGTRVDQLGGHAHLGLRATDASFHDVRGAQLAPHRDEVVRAAAVGKGRLARDHGEPPPARESGDQLLDQTIREELLAGIVAEVVEGKDRDRAYVRALRGGHVLGALEFGERHGRFGPVRDVQGPVDRRQMDLDRARRDAEHVGDLGVGQALRREHEDLSLPRREGRGVGKRVGHEFSGTDRGSLAGPQAPRRASS